MYKNFYKDKWSKPHLKSTKRFWCKTQTKLRTMRVFVRLSKDLPLVRLNQGEMKKIIKMVKVADGTYAAKNHK